MFYFFKNLKDASRKSNCTLLKNSNEISAKQDHNQSSNKPQYSSKKRIDIYSLSENSEESSEKTESENPCDVKEDYILRITDSILRRFGSE